jgi:hypothetical protein
MPWNEVSSNILTEKDLSIGWVGRIGPMGGICDKDATNILVGGAAG